MTLTLAADLRGLNADLRFIGGNLRLRSTVDFNLTWA